MVDQKLVLPIENLPFFTGAMRADSAEYRTLIQHTSELVEAVRSNLDTLSVSLYHSGFFINNVLDELIEEARPLVVRSARLVELVQNRVRHDPADYHTFTAILQMDPVQYRDNILQKLEDTYIHEKEGTNVVNLLYFLELIPPLNCSHTGYLTLAGKNKSRPRIVPAPCMCAIILVGVAQCSIV